MKIFIQSDQVQFRKLRSLSDFVLESWIEYFYGYQVTTFSEGVFLVLHDGQ